MSNLQKLNVNVTTHNSCNPRSLAWGYNQLELSGTGWSKLLLVSWAFLVIGMLLLRGNILGCL